MTHDEFYSRLLENRRIIQPPRFGLREERRAWVPRASMADASPQGQGDFWRSGEAPVPPPEPYEYAGNGSRHGRVVGRIAGGRIIPMDADDAVS